ncbi:MAG: hypothetical protein HC830_04880 [Bacteroidetes bacterium]|nr:hypothetical protein [Bacteroidota bacterium]
MINSRFGEYSLLPEIEGNVISFKREFIIYKGEYSLIDYPDFFSFIQKIRKANSLIILLTKQ